MLVCLQMALIAGSVASAVPTDVATPPDPAGIIGGDRVEPGSWPAVVGIETATKLCSGTLIGPTTVLTAAHCVRGQRARTTVVYLGEDRASAVRLDVDRVEFHPLYCGEASCGDDTYDFGILRLAEAVDLGRPFPELLLTQEAWDEAMRPGNVVLLVGWGTDVADDADFDEDGSGVKRMLEARIDRLTPGGLQFFVSADEGADSCKGDSGGPAFVRAEGSVRLAGVLSAGSSPCGMGGVYGAPIAAIEWLVQRNAHEPASDDCIEQSCLDTRSPTGGCAVSQRADWAWIFIVLLAWRRRSEDAPTRGG